MTSATVRVSRTLHIAALSDAIDWTTSLLEAQGDQPVDADVRRLRAYRQSYQQITGHPYDPDPAPPGTRSVAPQDVQPNPVIQFGGTR